MGTDVPPTTPPPPPPYLGQSPTNYDNFDCDGQNYPGVTFSSNSYLLATPSNGCGGTIFLNYPGLYNANPSQCAVNNAPTIPYTIFYY